jgi:NAD-dependent DNA ligase
MTSILNDLVTRLEKASTAYHNGQTLLMTDAEFDAGIDQLRALDPSHPFLSKVGAPIATGDEVTLPIPLPSLNKIKDQAAITKWSAKHNSLKYHISAKLDGCSALWLPHTKQLYTRGDGIKGRDISAFVPYFQGLCCPIETAAVRGELIMRTDSIAIPSGKLARNIVAGALNRKEADPVLFKEICFVAYELITPILSPEDGYKLLRSSGYEAARAAILPATDLTEARLSQIFTTAEEKSPYQLDGIVVAPNTARPSTYKADCKNPGDRVAWKTRLTAATARTIVREVEWNISYQGVLIPRVLFDPVTLAGANISAATGLHGRWIYDNGVGPGAEIEVRRAGDVIPQIIAVHKRAEGGAAMPAQYVWATTSNDPVSIHIKPVGNETATASACIKLTHALTELGAENIGSGLVAKLYAAGFTTLKQLFTADTADFATKVEGCKGKMAVRIWQGLRAKQATWTELNFMVASCTMPRGVGHTKLTPLLALYPNPATWPTQVASIKAKRPAGLSDKTIDAIADTIPAYLAWKAATGLSPASSGVPAPVVPEKQYVVVFTGVRDKEFEAALQAAGHIVADTVTKKTTHVIHADGPGSSTSTKIIKAQEMGVIIQSLSQAKANLGLN